jgi:predicted DNA-binding transcriptional regulator AlpA
MPQRDECIGLFEIAEMYSVTRNTAWRWSKRKGFPDPVGRVSANPAWNRSDIERWMETSRPRRTGRPPKSPTT